MKKRYYFKVVFAINAFLLMLYSLIGISEAATPDELIEEGKAALLEQYDIYLADDKFAQALAYTSEPSYSKANFWRALTVIYTNPDLKKTFTDLGILGDSGDADTTDDFIILDKEGNPKYNYTNVETIIIDNSDIDSGYSEAGSGWQTPTTLPNNPYDGDCRVHTADSGSNTAIWTPAITTAGEYDLYAWWPYSSNNAQDARYTIFYDGGYKDIYVSQKLNYNEWVWLGKYKFTPRLLARIELSSQAASGQVVADAVKLVFDGIYLSETSPDAFLKGDWKEQVDYNAYGRTYKEIDKGSGGSCIWTPDIPVTGKYLISAYWRASLSNATNAVYTITAQGGSPINISVNQQDNSYRRMLLGTYELQAGTGNTITLWQNKKGKVTTDGISIVGIRSAPNSTELQSDLNSLLTEIGQALTYLANISADFQDSADFHATDKFGNPALTEIDYGDVLILKAMLNLLKERISVFVSYDMNNIGLEDFNLNYTELLSVNTFLNRYTTLGNLTAGADTKLSNAKLALIESINSYLDAYNFITQETDSQDEDLITFNPQDIPEISQTKLQEILANLNGASPVYTARSDDEFVSRNIVIPNDAPYFKIAVNLREFFDNPKQFRDLRPQFNAKNQIQRNSMPDPTFGSILPDMTKAELDGIYQLGSILAQPTVSWNNDTVSLNLQWKKDTHSDFVSYKIYRSTSDEVSENSLKVYEGKNKHTINFTDRRLDANQRIYYYRLYTYYKNGDKIASPIRRVMTKFYVDVNGAQEKEDGSTEYPYKLLSNGVLAAKMGGKICVAGGTYVENYSTLRLWYWPSGITLEGGYEPNGWTRNIEAYQTIIDATTLGGSVITFYNTANIIIDGFTIQGGLYGIEAPYSKKMKIKNCIVRNNEYGIYVGSSSVSIENCSIANNSGTGIGIWGSSGSFTIKDSKIYGNGSTGIVFSSGKGQILNCEIMDNAINGIEVHYTKKVNIKNNLIKGNKNAGIYCYDASPQIINNTIISSTTGILYPQHTSSNNSPIIKNNIISSNQYGIKFEGTMTNPIIDYNDVWGNTTANYFGASAGSHDISANPLFISGPYGDYYLSQIASGQNENSPCVDAGNATAKALSLNNLTTKTNGEVDAGIADLGYHYPLP